MSDRAAMLRRGAFEFLTIVAGILAAFYVEEFRDSRHAASLEREYAGRLESDLEDALRNLTTGVSWTSDRAASGRAVLAHLSGEAELTPALLAIAAVQTGLLPISGARRLGRRTTYDELVSSGNLTVLQDPELRDQLARYYEEYARVGGRVEDRPRGWLDTVEGLLRPDLALLVDGSCAGENVARCLEGVEPYRSDLARFASHLEAGKDRIEADLNRVVQYQDRQHRDLSEFLARTETMLADLRARGLTQR